MEIDSKELNSCENELNLKIKSTDGVQIKWVHFYCMFIVIKLKYFELRDLRNEYNFNISLLKNR